METKEFASLAKDHRFQLWATGCLTSAIGLVVGYTLAKKKLEKQYLESAQTEIEAAKKYYSTLKKEDPALDPVKLAEKYQDSNNEESLEVTEISQILEPYSPSEKQAIWETNYREQVAETVAAQPQPCNVFKDSKPVDDSFDMELEESFRTDEEPYIITLDEFRESQTEYDQVTITYYAKDDTLVDETDQPIDEIDYTIGEDNLRRFGHGSKDNNILYVRNDKLQLEFEVIKSRGSYAEEVLGFIEHSDRRELRKFRTYDD